MKIIKNICLFFFIIITIVFTIGYSALPILKANAKIPNPTDGSSNILSSSFYIGYVTNFINDMKNTYTENTNYSDINNNIKLVFNTLLYSCIGVTLLMSLGIIIALLGLKFISKIIFFLALFVMIVIVIAILVINFSKNIIDILPSNISKYVNLNQDGNTGLDTGSILIIGSTSLMFIIYIIYYKFA